MKFVCFGFLDESKWAALSESEQSSFMATCFDYDDELRRGGHFAGGQALQASSNAATVRWEHGKARVTDGPFVETKEQVGGVLILEARDLNHAIALISKHPGIKAGGFEIRGIDDHVQGLIDAREKLAPS